MNEARRLVDANAESGDLSQGGARGIDVSVAIENGLVVLNVLSEKAVECR